MPLDEIVPGSTVRVAVKHNVQYVSLRDFIRHYCGKNQNDAAEVWRNIPESSKSELKDTVLNLKFPGRGQSEQPVITFPGMIKLMMFLPGAKAKENRTKMVKILHKFFAGDPALLGEIEANAASDSPLAQMARDSLAAESSGVKRKREDPIETERARAELHALKVDTVSKFASTMELINPNWRQDARLRLQTEDWLKNVAFNSSSAPRAGVAAITNGAAGVDLSESISVSEVAQELGFRLNHSQLISVGRTVAKNYRAKYDAEPPIHKQWVDGAARDVKSYTAKDRDLIVDALAENGFE
jgi:hypothetical protein